LAGRGNRPTGWPYLLRFVGKRRGTFREASVTAVVPNSDLGRREHGPDERRRGTGDLDAVDTAEGATVLREPVTAM